MLVEAFLSGEVSSQVRHQRRRKKIKAAEREGRE
jgi:hypothetical protein